MTVSAVPDVEGVVVNRPILKMSYHFKEVARQYPISEIFGPTRQGEGPQAGMYTYFVRFAGCDWDCDWCDTKYAVNPKYPNWHKVMMTMPEILFELGKLGAQPGDWITLSGGNPALFVDDEFVNVMLNGGVGFRLAMETQGSRVLTDDANLGIGCLIVSPKPPSSKMHGRFVPEVVVNLINGRDAHRQLITAVKFVAFDLNDLEWIVRAKEAIEKVAKREGVTTQYLKWYMSAGTPLLIELPDRPEGLTDLDRARLRISDGITSLWLTTLNDRRFKDIVMLGQLHGLVWGQKAGV